jgi:endo-1,4-beta-D-glucanase Y
MKKIVSLVAIFMALSGQSQTQSFPADKTFSYGLMASNKSSDDALAAYTTWKTNFVESCTDGSYRVKFDTTSQTVSEGIAYGMLLAAYSADQTLFDGFWLYYKNNMNSNGVMNWKINGCDGTLGYNGATDADLDAAFALIVADYQWGSTGTVDYKTNATTLITAIKTYEVESSTYVLKPGDQFGGSSLTNPSYFSPGYYRTFGTYTNDATFWNNVADSCYTVINNNLTENSAVGGLVSDWCMSTGAYSSDASGYTNQGQRYSYDAARTPWRIAVDYAFYGTSEAGVYAKKCSDFVRETLGGTANIKDGYYQNGTLSGEWHNATFVGAFACAAMAGENQTHLDSSYSDLRDLSEPYSYYNQTLKTLYLFLLNGDFYLPSTTSSTLATTDFEDTSSTISLYPNPSNAVFTLTGIEDAKVYVYSVDGKLLFEKTMNSTTNQIDLSTQKTGIYLAKIVQGETTVVKKLIVK